MQGAAARIRRDAETVRWAVWHTAALARVERLPEFEAFAADTPRRRQTPEEMERALMAWQIAMERAQ